MTETNKKLSRREAIKIVGAAAGASLLANLPSKWSKPKLTGASMPAHAQTSCSNYAMIVEIIAVSGAAGIDGYTGGGNTAPTSTSGTYNQVGYTLYWDCTPTCIAVGSVAAAGANSLTVRFTVMGGAPYDVNLLNGENYNIHLDSSTGNTAISNTNGEFLAVDGCPYYID